MDGQYCILRCASSATLPLAASLTAAGFEAWTPTETVTKRVPRANIKRRLTLALMPSYAFAPAEYLVDLLALSNCPVKDHKDFRLFKLRDRVPLIAEASLAPLRLAERRRTSTALRPYRKGERVRLTEGSFAGLDGIVEDARGQWVNVSLPGFKMLEGPLRIAAWHLLRDDERKAA